MQNSRKTLIPASLVPAKLLMKTITSFLILTCVFTVSQSHFTANPKDYYYAHRQRQDLSKSSGRLHSKPVSHGSVMMSPNSIPDRQRLHEPSCAELRKLWRASVQDISNKLGFFVLPDDVKHVLSNPYYRSLIRSPGRFGKIVTAASEDGSSNSKQLPEILYGQERKYPGSFEEAPDDPGLVQSSFGNVVYSPDDDTAASRKTATFGDIVVVEAPSLKHQQRIQDSSEAKSMEHERKTPPQAAETVTSSSGRVEDQGSVYPISSLARKQKSEHQSPDTLSASDFFNSVWHEEPVKF